MYRGNLFTGAFGIFDSFLLSKRRLFSTIKRPHFTKLLHTMSSFSIVRMGLSANQPNLKDNIIRKYNSKIIQLFNGFYTVNC
jgi:hypothetical protein